MVADIILHLYLVIHLFYNSGETVSFANILLAKKMSDDQKDNEVYKLRCIFISIGFISLDL